MRKKPKKFLKMRKITEEKSKRFVFIQRENILLKGKLVREDASVGANVKNSISYTEKGIAYAA